MAFEGEGMTGGIEFLPGGLPDRGAHRRFPENIC
jgi:hypothetical protein